MKHASLVGARFTLKKRPIRNQDNMVNISSYNSDFLNGIFADVAKVSILKESTSGKRCFDEISCSGAIPSSDEICTNALAKKSRASLEKSLSRVQTSAVNLPFLGGSISPKGSNELFSSQAESHSRSCPKIPPLNHQDSLHFQLNSVSVKSGTSEGPKNTVQADDAAVIAFPNLPATVSDSSCQAGLTRVNLVRQASIPENSSKESFGWFVDLDDNKTVEANVNLPYAVSSDSLAFQAPTAPKRVDDNAELEWAQAADTIDDVLGDFF